MSRVVIIGGTGHVGTYLVPRLVCAGFEVINVRRGERAPYQPHGAWKSVRTVKLSREAEEEEAGALGRKIRELRPDIVIDMICFTEASARHLVEALRGQVRHFLIGNHLDHGPSVEVPITEMQPRRPFGEYGIAKAQIEAYLIETARRESFPVTIIHPGHIVGPGWAPLNPAGHFNPDVFTVLAKGEELAVPNSASDGDQVHAGDLAQLFMCAIASWSASVGEAFHAVSPAAVTLRGYAEAMAARSAANPSCAICRGRNGRAGIAKSRLRRLTTTSRTARIAVSPRRRACSTIGPATARSRPCANL